MSDGERRNVPSLLPVVCTSVDIGSGGAVAPSTLAIDFNCFLSSGGKFLAISSKEAGVG